jgi:organic radical activating enzyme
MKKLDPKETVCRDLWAYPVIDLHRPRVRTCCKRKGTIIDKQDLERLGTDIFLNLPNVVEDRIAVLDGVQVNGCDTCWRLENQGLTSFRLGAPDFQFQFNNINGNPPPPDQFRPFEKLVELGQQISYSDKPNKLDLTLGSHCDQKCVYCDADFSTQWETENREYGMVIGKISHMPHEGYIPLNDRALEGYYDKFIEWFDTVYEHLERIALLGGEPTSSPMFVPLSNHLINKLKIKFHHNCTLSIVTNLNWKRPVLEQILKIKEQLPHIKMVLEVSMESFGTKAEYIRKGVNWDRFLRNLNELAKLDNLEIHLITTLNALCISSLSDYLKIVRQIEIANNKNFKIIANRLVKPAWLGMGILDHRYSHYVTDTVEWLESTYPGSAEKADLINTLKSIIIEINQPRNDKLLGYFAFWIKNLDGRRDQSFEAVFPEFNTLLEEGAQLTERTYDKIEWQSWKS